VSYFSPLTQISYFSFIQTANGFARIEKDDAYIRRHGYGGDALDELLVKFMTNTSHSVAFFDFTVKIQVCFDL
jgi:hypothetical protein